MDQGIFLSFSSSFILKTWSDISDERTFGVPHYHPDYSLSNDSGTSHISVLSPEGDAVAVTTYVMVCMLINNLLHLA